VPPCRQTLWLVHGPAPPGAPPNASVWSRGGFVKRALPRESPASSSIRLSHAPRETSSTGRGGEEVTIVSAPYTLTADERELVRRAIDRERRARYTSSTVDAV
jgi:hypothetical protein